MCAALPGRLHLPGTTHAAVSYHAARMLVPGLGWAGLGWAGLGWAVVHCNDVLYSDMQCYFVLGWSLAFH